MVTGSRNLLYFENQYHYTGRMTTMPGPVLGDLDARVGQRLAGAGVRYTKGRRLVVRALGRAGGPRSAAELHERLRPGVPLSSLYRTLTVLAEAGVLARSHDGNGVALFELAEWLRGHHHHLVCVECGRVEDVDVGDEHERTLTGVVLAVAAAGDLELTGHRIDIEGVCGECRA